MHGSNLSTDIYKLGKETPQLYSNGCAKLILFTGSGEKKLVSLVK